MAELALAAAVVGAGGKVMMGRAAQLEGRASADAIRQSSEYQAAGLERRAGEERAVSQREAAAERLKAERTGSRALALAASSGGGVDNPTILDILSGIEGEGEYLASAKRYGGNQRSAGLLDQAAGTRYDGEVKAQSAKKRGDAAFAGSIFESIGTLGSAGMSYAGRTGGGGSSGSSIPDISGDPDNGWRLPKSRWGWN